MITLLIIIGGVLVIAACVWFFLTLAGGKTPGSAVRETEHVELLGPGGPDDPDAGN
ncbi:MAG TPA: hypothetical protein VH538_09400 [Gaiellaceae bacterium]